MREDEKMCPLTKMTCYGGECGWWYFGECGMALLARKTEEISNDLYRVRRQMEES